jgi:hypothetical protein
MRIKLWGEGGEGRQMRCRALDKYMKSPLGLISNIPRKKEKKKKSPD